MTAAAFTPPIIDLDEVERRVAEARQRRSEAGMQIRSITGSAKTPLGAVAVDPRFPLLADCILGEFEHLRWANETLLGLVAQLRAAGTPVRKQPLTLRQRQVYDFIAQSIADRRVAPTYDEIAQHFRWASLASVHEQLATLQQKGWIARRYNQARAITLTPGDDVVEAAPIQRRAVERGALASVHSEQLGADVVVERL